MSNYNAPQMTLYNRASNTPIAQPTNWQLAGAEGLTYSTYYPGGLYGECSFYVPRKIFSWWAAQSGQRLVVRNKTETVWEGYVAQLQDTVSESSMGTRVRAVGAWGDLMMRWNINRHWANNKTDGQTWVDQKLASDVDMKYSISHGTTTAGAPMIELAPRAGTLTNTTPDACATRYTAPVGETVARIKYSYDLALAAGSTFKISVFRSTNGSSWTEMTGASGETYTTGTTTVISATGTGSIDVNLATPSRYIELRMTQTAASTAVTTSDKIRGQFISIITYSTTSTVTSQLIAQQLVAYCTELNSGTGGIGVATYGLTEFISSGRESLADIMARAFGYSDSSQNRLGYYLAASDQAASPDGKPYMITETYPALTAYDYTIDLADPNITGFSIYPDLESIINYVVLQWQDGSGVTQYLTPTDSATLTDATSVAAYGHKEPRTPIDLGQSDGTTALNYGQRLLAAFKDPVWRMAGAIPVHGFIRGLGGQEIPAANIRAGKRIKLENFSSDPTGKLSGSLVMYTTKTNYNDRGGGSSSVTAGPLDVIVTA